MENNNILNYANNVLANMPKGWLTITTHRLDIYNEALAKSEFIDELETLFSKNDFTSESLSNLPTAYDYIRLGHPLSCLLEWVVAKENSLHPNHVIAFGSTTMPLLAILRKNLMDGIATKVLYLGSLPQTLDIEALKTVYGYNLEVLPFSEGYVSPNPTDCIVLMNESEDLGQITQSSGIDFTINHTAILGSVLMAQSVKSYAYVGEIQHVRRRETIAITPSDAHLVLNRILGNSGLDSAVTSSNAKASVIDSIAKITGAKTKALVASSGLSIQYAILMGLIDHAQLHHPDKGVAIVVPPNCYGGTNDQARRVAACLNNVEIVDLPVDGDHDMVQSIDKVLSEIAAKDAVPYIIAEIPTNPRVEVPNLEDLRNALSRARKTKNGTDAVDPVFILDQTFCPNVAFVGDEDILANVRTISFASGSKFPSGGKCTAGYCVGNTRAKELINTIEKHLLICDNEATDLQYQILSEQLPSMLNRVASAYDNTRQFVNFIEEVLPTAKINFVSEELAQQGFTPSVFSLDLPTKGNTPEEKEMHKRELNLRLINLMISKIPDESKYCVSYGQLKGCYWTIPATSTQGTTKEGDKDYIARVAVSPNLDLEKHKEVFLEFVKSM